MCQLSKILQYCCSTILFHGTVARLLIKNYYYIIFDSSLFLSTLSSSCPLFLFSHYFITFTLRLTLINPMEMPCKQSSSSSSLWSAWQRGWVGDRCGGFLDWWDWQWWVFGFDVVGLPYLCQALFLTPWVSWVNFLNFITVIPPFEPKPNFPLSLLISTNSLSWSSSQSFELHGLHGQIFEIHKMFGLVLGMQRPWVEHTTHFLQTQNPFSKNSFSSNPKPMHMNTITRAIHGQTH